MEKNLGYYHIFYEVAKEKNLSRAAKNLYISQPAISKSIQKLEENMGVTLFQRNSRGVLLTEEGKVLYRHVKTAFESLESGEETLKKMQLLDTGHIRIGVSTTLCKFLLLPYLQTFIRRHPHIRLSLFCQSSNQTLALLEEGKIDIGLTGKPESNKSIIFHPMMEIQDTFVCTSSCLSNLSLSAEGPEDLLFGNATVLLLDKENMSRHYIDNYLSENQIQPKHLLEVSTMDLLIEFAKIGLGVACVIKNFVLEELACGTLTEIPLKVPIYTREVGFAYESRFPLSKAASEFLNSISK